MDGTQLFVFRATRYCSWYLGIASSGPVDPVRAVRVLSGLILAASKLEDLANPEIPPPPDLGPEIGSLGGCPQLDLPTDCESRGIKGCHMRRHTGGLAGCLRYMQIRLERGIELEAAGEEDRALALWRFGFAHEWGESSICALRFFHSMIEDSRAT